MPKDRPSPKVAVIIVCWNNRDLLEECYESVYGQTYENWHIILVDNGSKDDSVAYTKKHHPKVQIIETGANLGFAVANNIGMKEAFKDPTCKYALLLNTDARIREDWMEEIVGFAEGKPHGFSFQSPTLDYYNHEVLDSCGILIDRQALATQMGYRQTNVRLKTMRVFGVNAAACLYSRAFLEAQPFGDDYFDHDLFMYLEDVDIATRAVMMGWENWFVNRSEAYHMGSASSGKNPGFSLYMTYRNNALVLVKNLPVRVLLKALPGLLRAELHRLRGFWREGKYPLIKAILKGRLNSFWRIPIFLRKRRELRKYWKISEAKLWDMMKIPKLEKIPASERPFGFESITAVVVSRNSAGTLQDCLEALLAQNYPKLSIIVVDNGSSDGSAKLVSEKFPAVTLLAQKDNLGLPNGFNVGITKALLDEPDYFALVQANTVVGKDWLSSMIETMRRSSSAFAVASKLLVRDETGQATVLNQGYGYNPVTGPTPVMFSGDKAREVFAASDYASLYRTSSLGPIGMMDGDFFDGLADVDFCFRARLMGETVVSNPKAEAFVTPPHHPARYDWYHTQKNLFFMYLKNLPFKLFWRYFPAALAQTVRTLLVSIRRGFAIQQLKAALKCGVRLPRMLRYRWRINVRRTSTAAVVNRLFSTGTLPSKR